MNILCFGDSNTFGVSPIDGSRFSESERWPTLLKQQLGIGFEVIEAGQPNRTLVNNPPFSGDKSGVKYLKPYLEAQPLDVIIIQLGTNDLKARFALSAIEIGKALEELALAIKAFYQCKTLPKIIIVSPPRVHEVGSYKSIYAGASKKAEQLSIEYKAVSDRQECVFIDGFTLIDACESEGVHWPFKEHKRFAKQLLPLF
jgi:lysophospholipase L1-like esterase